MKDAFHNIEEALLHKNIISKEQMIKARALQTKGGTRLEEALVTLGFVTYKDITQCLSSQHGLPIYELSKNNISLEAVNLLPVQLAKKHCIIPVQYHNGIVTLAVSSPPDLGFIDNLRFLLNADIRCVLASLEDIRNTIRKCYDQESTETVDSLLKDFKRSGEQFSGLITASEKQPKTDIELVDDEGPIVQLVSLIIKKAIVSRVSDIHIEPLSNRLRVRYRIDGICQEADVLPKHLQDSIISRVKILSGVDISEKRRPQDGRISLQYANKDLDIRVSCLPSIYGESVVMRILEKSTVLMSLINLHLYKSDYERYHSIIRRPNGILLITGPTGSGKTTTLYATVNDLNQSDTKIITAEDPVEYTLSGVNQCEVNEKIGYSFPAILRTILRQDPNIILVGEIRDVETAETAIAAALTGHFVLSTLHTNDASAAITRLIDMGIKPFLVATSLQGIMAQRLVRTICKRCKEPVSYTSDQLLRMGFEADSLLDVSFYRGKGCSQCNNVGYHGRIGIYELIDMNETLRDLTYRMADTNEIRKAAKDSGMTTLKEDGLRKAKEGKTTLEEVFRVTGNEG
ncbi:MAG: Flp pilus assembly complex ATPase component TadA [Candidatus Brocadiaceae bacterium]|nr:Flp pilus assembly complex ATPase component TadA [Candidatus Brocadiaceae bacterium]